MSETLTLVNCRDCKHCSYSGGGVYLCTQPDVNNDIFAWFVEIEESRESEDLCGKIGSLFEARQPEITKITWE